MSLWDSIVDQAGKAAEKVGNAAGVAAQKTKLKTEILMIERELANRQKAFGVALYDYVEPLSKHPSFYSSDDTLTVTLQPPLITAQREISALNLKRAALQEKINQAAATRAAAFTPATTWQEKLMNAGKSTALAGNETKLSTEMVLLKSEMNHHKEQFGLNLYKILEDLEDTKQWLPTDREIRSIYDTCRRDVEKIKKRKLTKDKELEALEGGATSYAAPVPAPDEMSPPSGIPPPPHGMAPPVPSMPSAYGTSQPAAVPPTQPYPPQQQQQMQQPPNSFPGAMNPNTTNGTTHDPFASAPPIQQQQPVAPAPAQPPAVQGQGMFAYPTDPFAPVQQQQQQQPQGFGGAAAAAPAMNDPFAAVVQTQQPPQQHDPFASAPPLQQQQQPDPFAPQQPAQQQQQQTPGFFQSSNSSSNYDPFSGL